MNLTRAERAILANQFRILELLEKDDAEHYAWKRKTLEDGYSFLYSRVFEHIDEEELSEEESLEVLHILEMFSQLRLGFARIPDKAGIEETSIKFWGFDGNTEGRYWSFARHFFRSDDVDGLKLQNSHMPLMQAYRRMKEEWERSDDKMGLSREDILRITAARIHPDNR